MRFLNFESKLDFEVHVNELLSHQKFEQPFTDQLLEALFIEHDWCKLSRDYLIAMRAEGIPLKFKVVDALDDDSGQRLDGPHFFIYYPDSHALVAEKGWPLDGLPGAGKDWILRLWKDCVRAKTVKMFEAKVKSDMRRWCRGQLEAHRLQFPTCEQEGCGQPADHGYHTNPSFDEIAAAIIQRARLKHRDKTIPLPWFIESRHFWPDYPDGFRDEFLNESADAKVRSLCSSCFSKPGTIFLRRMYEEALANADAEDAEMAALFRRARERNLRSRAEGQAHATRTVPPHKRTSADSEHATGAGD